MNETLSQVERQSKENVLIYELKGNQTPEKIVLNSICIKNYCFTALTSKWVELVLPSKAKNDPCTGGVHILAEHQVLKKALLFVCILCMYII